MAFTGPLEDRIAIRELHETYADAAFRDDAAAWLDCWADDAIWITSFGEVRGKAALATQWEKVGATFAAIGFFPTVGAIEIDGDRALTRGYVREIATMHDGGFLKVVGRYDDEVVRENGAWRFARREYSVLMRERTNEKGPAV